MQLTSFTDYALRALIYINQVKRPVSLNELSSAYGMSRNHLIKAINRLEKSGFVKTKRGRGGGISLSRPATEINLGDVILSTEPHFNIVECFNEDKNSCPISKACLLKNVLVKANKAFLEEVASYSLEDISFDKD